MQLILPILLSAVTVFRVDPWCNIPFLPDADPAGGVKTESISFAAARGEYEAISFVVLPDRDYAQVDVKVSDLKAEGGATVPAAAADPMSVKVWFRPGGRWLHSWAGRQDQPTPINNLVLHDDTLVKVDWEKKINYLRGDYDDGPTYMDMSHTELKTFFNNDTQPVRDAERFVPFDLRKGFRQQYLVTWHVPADAKAGAYRGTLALVAQDGTKVAELGIALEVYPFALPSARTHYDTSKRYYSYWMGSPNLDRLMRFGYRLDRAERKLRNIYRNMVAHNASDLTDVGDLQKDDFDSFGLRTLIIARQEGMRADPLINGYAWDPDRSAQFVCVNPGSDLKAARVPEEHPELYTNSLKRYTAYVENQMAIMRKYLGHANCYFSNPDECSERTYRRGYGYWRIIHDRGGLVWNDYAFPEHCGWTTDVNDVPAGFDHETAWGWHRGGAKCFTYAGTFTGPECPDLWRRNKGIRFWYSDFDGQHEYCFFDGRSNRWNDFVHYERYCQFGIVYWTYDGLVSTLAWEANREALDDVRYFSLLRLRAEAALKSSDAETRRLGREALVWQDGVDPEYEPDLDAFRRETAAWIKRLVAKVGEEPPEKPTELPPPAVLPPERRAQEIPQKGADPKAFFAYADKCDGRGVPGSMGNRRFDLAVKALENLYGDESADLGARADAAIRAAGFFCTMNERKNALAALDQVLAAPKLATRERSKLKLARTSALLADVKFEERFTRAQLEEAAASAEEALKGGGATERQRSETVCKLVRGYLSAQEYDRCVEYADARLKDTSLDRDGRTDLHFFVARAHMYKEDWPKALKAFDETHRAHNDDKDKIFRRKVLPFEAIAAEKDKDYERAVNCLTELIPTYDPEEGKQYIKELKDRILKLQPLARKSTKITMGTLDDDDSKESISLDE